MRTITRVITNRLLKRLPVPDRDRSWSQHTYHALHDGSPLGRLIRWAAREGHDYGPLLRPLIAGRPTLIRHPLSRELCQGIGWFKPAGGLNDSMAWVPMLTDRHGTARPNDYVSVVTPTGKTIYDFRTHQVIHVSR